jgi:hypothetical protein
MKNSSEQENRTICTKWDCSKHNGGYGLPCNDGYETEQLNTKEWIKQNIGNLFWKEYGNKETCDAMIKISAQSLDNFISQAVSKGRGTGEIQTDY